MMYKFLVCFSWPFCIAVVLIVLGLTGESDYQMEIIEEQIAIDNFCNGIWPDIYDLEPDCDE